MRNIKLGIPEKHGKYFSCFPGILNLIFLINPKPSP
jgi:hypothetical protein